MFLFQINSGPSALAYCIAITFSLAPKHSLLFPSEICLPKGNQNGLYANNYNYIISLLKTLQWLSILWGKRQNPSVCEADSHTPSCSFCSWYTWPYSVPSHPLYPVSSWSLCRSHPQSFSENLFRASLTRPNQHMRTPIAAGDIPLTHIEITSLHLCDHVIMVHLPHQTSFIRTGTISGSAHHDISRAQPSAYL